MDGGVFLPIARNGQAAIHRKQTASPWHAKPPLVTEAEFLAVLGALPLHPGALGLADDAARLGDFVLTTDLIAEGVHFLASDPPGDVAWKLVAVNLSDLAAKGATPEGVLLGYPLGDDAWDRAFLAGLREALEAFACPLLGGDTVKVAGPRILALTAIGRADPAPSRAGARPGDMLWVTGTIGDAGIGLASALGADGPDELLRRYRRPVPRLAEGRALAPAVTAMMDVSDGLLIDADRMARASGCAAVVEVERIPPGSSRPFPPRESAHSRQAPASASSVTAPPSRSRSVSATNTADFARVSGRLRSFDRPLYLTTPRRPGTRPEFRSATRTKGEG
jgi:thiamine-monophosphate kinase